VERTIQGRKRVMIMTNEEAVKMLKAKRKCLIQDVSGIYDDCNRKLCNECYLNYEQGNMGQQAEYLRMSVEALEQEPCEDCISREQAKTAIRDRFKDLPSRVEINTVLNELPSVRPKEKVGHWQKISADKYSEHAAYYFRCSECGKDIIGEHNYCANCGCRMSEGSE